MPPLSIPRVAGYWLHPFVLLLLMPLAAPATASAPALSPQLHVALVFDDGPVAPHAEQILALCAREQIHVTFSHVAETAARDPATARAVTAAGHEIANHSFAHRHPRELDDAALAHEIVAAQSRLTQITGVAPRLYWLPYLELDPRMPALAASAGISVFTPPPLVGSEDWRPEVDAAAIFRNATTGVSDGAVIGFHEWRRETVAQLPAIVAELKRQNCVFLTLSELAEYRRKLNAAAPVSTPSR